MKKTLLNLLPLAAIALILTSFSDNDAALYPGGAPAGYTGSPGDGHNCTACHGGSSGTVQGWITSDAGPDGYIPGQTYTITVTVTGSGSKGFEVSPQNAAGDQLGTLIAGSGEKLVGSGKYVTHSNSSNSNPKVWTFQWTAPDAGTGPVTMYGAFALNKSQTKLSNLEIPEYIATGISDKSTETSLQVYPNPADKSLKISFDLQDNPDVVITLVNSATGRRNVLKSERMGSGVKNIVADCSAVAEGIYILRVEAGRQVSSAKVVIRH